MDLAIRVVRPDRRDVLAGAEEVRGRGDPALDGAALRDVDVELTVEALGDVAHLPDAAERLRRLLRLRRVRVEDSVELRGAARARDGLRDRRRGCSCGRGRRRGGLAVRRLQSARAARVRHRSRAPASSGPRAAGRRRSDCGVRRRTGRRCGSALSAPCRDSARRGSSAPRPCLAPDCVRRQHASRPRRACSGASPSGCS